MQNGIIALLTDFGNRDGFVGILKGVMLCIDPDLMFVDIAHEIPPQDIRHAGWVLDQAFDYFPRGTVFLTVVDPDVGNPKQQKLAISIKSANKYLVLPDNGLASPLLRRYPDAQIYAIENQSYFREGQTPSQTFHGRDIYAPVAAALAKASVMGTIQNTLTDLGPLRTIQTIKILDQRPAEKSAPGELRGQIDAVDIYGNLITNIPSDWLQEQAGKTLQIRMGKTVYPALRRDFYGARVGQGDDTLIVVPGSHGKLEVAYFGANAHRRLGVNPGDFITITSLASPLD